MLRYRYPVTLTDLCWLAGGRGRRGGGGGVDGVVPGMLCVSAPHRQDTHQEGEGSHNHLPWLARAELTVTPENLKGWKIRLQNTVLPVPLLFVLIEEGFPEPAHFILFFTSVEPVT